MWVYVSQGYEAYLKKALPITDVAYFTSEVNSYGELVGVPDRNKLAGFDGRVHLVAVCDSRSLTHFVIEPDSAIRKTLVRQLVNAAKPFDGLQLDFEAIASRDATNYQSFLKELKQELKGKPLSVALRPRYEFDEVYDYKKIGAIVDRVLVMAYEEHYAPDNPGFVASMPWCRRIAKYSLSTIPKEKLIMGLPFFGRSWGSINPTQAYIYPTIQRIKIENKVESVQRVEGVPLFQYTVPVTVTIYYDDAYSLSQRMAMYAELGVEKVGFWRLSQEDPTVWDCIEVKQN